MKGGGFCTPSGYFAIQRKMCMGMEWGAYKLWPYNPLYYVTKAGFLRLLGPGPVMRLGCPKQYAVAE